MAQREARAGRRPLACVEPSWLLLSSLRPCRIASLCPLRAPFALRYGGLDRPWVPDVVGRAYGNRGNARSRQGRLAEALGDYNTAIALCPWSVDPLLNRGVALEALGRFEGEGRRGVRACCDGVGMRALCVCVCVCVSACVRTRVRRPAAGLEPQWPYLRQLVRGA